MPRSICFVQVDFSECTIRWSPLQEHSLSLHAVIALSLDEKPLKMNLTGWETASIRRWTIMKPQGNTDAKGKSETSSAGDDVPPPTGLANVSSSSGDDLQRTASHVVASASSTRDQMPPAAQPFSSDVEHGSIPRWTCAKNVTRTVAASDCRPSTSSSKQQPRKQSIERRRFSDILPLAIYAAGKGSMSRLSLTYRDQHGFAHELVLNMPSQKASAWHQALQEMLAALQTLPASVAHRRWVLSCLDSIGAASSLNRSDLGLLLNRANIGMDSSDQTHLAARISSLEVPGWAAVKAGHFSVFQVIGMLAHLSAEQDSIEMLHSRYAGGPQMNLSGWLAFLRAEQMHDATSPQPSVSTAALDTTVKAAETEVEEAQRVFRYACQRGDAGVRREAGLSAQQFAMILLSPDNDAVGPAAQSPVERLSHHWCACSHNV